MKWQNSHLSIRILNAWSSNFSVTTRWKLDCKFQLSNQRDTLFQQFHVMTRTMYSVIITFQYHIIRNQKCRGQTHSDAVSSFTNSFITICCRYLYVFMRTGHSYILLCPTNINYGGESSLLCTSKNWVKSMSVMYKTTTGLKFSLVDDYPTCWKLKLRKETERLDESSLYLLLPSIRQCLQRYSTPYGTSLLYSPALLLRIAATSLRREDRSTKEVPPSSIIGYPLIKEPSEVFLASPVSSFSVPLSLYPLLKIWSTAPSTQLRLEAHGRATIFLVLIRR